METTPVTSHQYSPGNARANGVVRNAAVPMYGPVYQARAPGTVPPPATGDGVAAGGRVAVADAKTPAVPNLWQSLGVALVAGFLLGRLSR